MRILHPQFRDENTDSRYPFTDSSSLTSDVGAVLPPSWMLDALIYPPSNDSPLRLDSIFVDGASMKFTIVNTESVTICTGTIDISSGIEGSIPLADPYGRPAGLLLADPVQLTALRQYAVGTVTFPPGNADFVATVVVPTPEPGVRGFADADNSPLTGDVWLVGDNGVNLLNTNTNEFTLHVVGEPLATRLNCQSSPNFSAPRFLETINGIPATDWGGFTLQVGHALAGSPALRIFVDNGALVIGLARPGST